MNEEKKTGWRRFVRQVEPYVPGEQPKDKDVIKLNTNENPYPPAPGVFRAAAQFDAGRLPLYPAFPEQTELAQALADYYHIQKEELFIGVGSDDVLANAFQTFFNSDRPILFPDITYSFYSVWADLYRIPYERPALDENFRIRVEDYIRSDRKNASSNSVIACEKENSGNSAIACETGNFIAKKNEIGGIIFPNPNAPTSVAMEPEAVEEIIRLNPDVVVIVDEAYIDFGGTSVLPLIHKYDNLLVVQTFSKSRSMAGARIGFAMGNPELIAAMNAVKYSSNSYTLNSPSLAMGAAAVQDVAYFKETVQKIIRTRETAKARLAELGFTCLDSKANFLFVTHESIPAKEIFEYLKTKKIYVRYFAQPRIDNYLRITVGTEEQMEKLYRALGELVNC
ncbi:MAG: histidinol-phosphate transaminase [Lachnospiraceae bacterium]|nr:histidinol-phosphate transaminase [Lachnospiraceae bacterium]